MNNELQTAIECKIRLYFTKKILIEIKTLRTEIN